MMDAQVVTRNGNQTIAFISALQAEHYGGYAKALVSLKVDLVMPPSVVEEYWSDLTDHYEVGHA